MSVPLSALTQPMCHNCESDCFSNDIDMVCTNCGCVYQNSLTDEGAEYRTFQDDSSSYQRVRVGQSYNSYLPYSLGTDDDADRRFINDMKHDIKEVLMKISHGCGLNRRVQYRAEYLVNMAFQQQLKQKRDTCKKTWTRKKFSRRKQFVVTALWQALREAHLKTWSVKDLDDLLTGQCVSLASVKRCLQDLMPYITSHPRQREHSGKKRKRTPVTSFTSTKRRLVKHV